MKTLVIHPDGDITTDVLCQIYTGKGYDIFRGQRLTSDILAKIPEYSRIIMLGHGSPFGLFNAEFDYIINGFHANLLKDKICVAIWCHAAEFAQKYKLKGFFSGMFISEVYEGLHYQIYEIQEEITRSNELFASNMRKLIDLPTNEIYSGILETYLDDDSKLFDFNREGFRHFS